MLAHEYATLRIEESNMRLADAAVTSKGATLPGMCPADKFEVEVSKAELLAFLQKRELQHANKKHQSCKIVISSVATLQAFSIKHAGPNLSIRVCQPNHLTLHLGFKGEKEWPFVVDRLGELMKGAGKEKVDFTKHFLDFSADFPAHDAPPSAFDSFVFLEKATGYSGRIDEYILVLRTCATPPEGTFISICVDSCVNALIRPDPS